MGLAINAHSAPPKFSGSMELQELSDVIEAIGTNSFAVKVLSCLDRIVGADDCAIYELTDRDLRQVASSNPDGPAFMKRAEVSVYQIKRRLSQIGKTSARLESFDLLPAVSGGVGRKRQRITICSRKLNFGYCLQILCSVQADDDFDDGIVILRTIADLLMSIIVKHAEVSKPRWDPVPALSSLAEIHKCLLDVTNLSHRQGEVCARILYGLSSCGIALDLGIGKESVVTYRKRAYQRLGISTQRELLMLYLAHWNVVRGYDTEGGIAPLTVN